MLLAIDIGNTNTVFGLFEGERLDHYWRIKTDARDTADELALTYRGMLADHPVTGVAACSTVPAALRELRVMLAAYYPNVPKVLVEPGVRTGVGLQYDNPKEVGADRIVNTLAAYHLVHGPAIVVDFGTTTNFDVVGANGDFLGGALAPGIEISLDALAARGAAAQGRARRAAQPDRQEHGRGAAVGNPVRLRRPGRRDGAKVASCARSRRPGIGRGDRHRRARLADDQDQRNPPPPQTDLTPLPLRFIFHPKLLNS